MLSVDLYHVIVARKYTLEVTTRPSDPDGYKTIYSGSIDFSEVSFNDREKFRDFEKWLYQSEVDYCASNGHEAIIYAYPIQ